MAGTKEAPAPDDVRGPGRALDATMDGVSVKTWIGIGIAIAVVVLGFGAFYTYGLDRGTAATEAAQSDMDGGMGAMGAAGDAPRLPPVSGFYEGENVFFVHTEASDPEVAELLTKMMGSPVITVPELAGVPGSALGDVYVFANGIEPEGARGPMGFQPDIFDSAPGEDDYTPLRTITLVEWKAGARPELLSSAAQVEEALARGDITVEQPGVIVNMPFVTWPDGER